MRRVKGLGGGVGIPAADAPDFEKIAESLREEPPEGTSVALPTP